MAVAVKFDQKQEEKPGKSFGLSFILHAILLLIAFFLVLPNTPPVPDPPLPKSEEFLVKLDVKAFKERAKEIKQVPRKVRDVQFVNNDDGGNKGTKGRADEGEAAPDIEAAPPAPTENPNPVPATTPEVLKPSSTPVLNAPKPVIKAPSQVITQKTEEDIPTVKPSPPTKTPSTGAGTPTKPNTGPTVPAKSGTTTPTRSGPTNNGGGAPNSNGSTPGANPGRNSNADGNGSGGGKVGTGGGVSGGKDGSEGTGNSSSGTGEFDGSGNGVFGRKVIYRDLNAMYASVNQTGKVAVKVCVNQGGNVTYAELINEETTIKDKTSLKKFMIAARKCKYQPDRSAPKEQCGKFIFKIDNTVNNKLKG